MGLKQNYYFFICVCLETHLLVLINIVRICEKKQRDSLYFNYLNAQMNASLISKMN